MKRRSFVQSFAAIPLTSYAPTREIRAKLLLDRTSPVHLIVTAHAYPKKAEQYRLEWVSNPFETVGEWYVMDSEVRTLPPELADLPGSLTWHAALYGEAAEEQEYLVGAFRREHITCIVRIREDNEQLMIAIAEHISEQPLPELLESVWSSSHLQRFVPQTEDLGLEVTPDNTFWP